MSPVAIPPGLAHNPLASIPLADANYPTAHPGPGAPISPVRTQAIRIARLRPTRSFRTAPANRRVLRRCLSQLQSRPALSRPERSLSVGDRSDSTKLHQPIAIEISPSAQRSNSPTSLRIGESRRQTDDKRHGPMVALVTKDEPTFRTWGRTVTPAQ